MGAEGVGLCIRWGGIGVEGVGFHWTRFGFHEPGVWMMTLDAQEMEQCARLENHKRLCNEGMRGAMD